jgi:predicted alpha/beta superfamily hydrolase
VLYLHDGQKLGINICFGWGNWELDKALGGLCRARKLQEIILVAIDISPARYAEYCGRDRSGETNANTEFEDYASFLIQQLKPEIDSEYRTRPEPANTGGGWIQNRGSARAPKGPVEIPALSAF